jgi:predicted nucleic acid-binding protein
MIIEKSGIKKKEYLTLMQKLFRYIEIIPENKTSLNIEKASKIIGHIDPKDVIFVATKLCVKNSIIWSDDNDFDKQNKVKFIKTKGIIEIFKYLERCDYT